MKPLSRAVSLPGRIQWRSGQVQVRLGILAAVLLAILAALLLRDHLSFTQVGYGGIAIASLIASAGLIIPVPAVGAVCAGAVFLNPLFVALIASSCETVGELTGYFLGYTGREAVTGTRLYRRWEPWIYRCGWLPLFVLSLVPNPVFDIVGIAAGVLHYPLWRFLPVVWAGKTLKFLALAYGCAYSIDWLTSTFGFF